VLADFEVIQSDEVIIGDSGGDPAGVNPWTESFNSGGRLVVHTGTDRKLKAFITLMVRGINISGTFAEVEINQQPVGRIFASVDSIENWRTQSISFESSVLNNGDNRILIRAVPSADPSPGNLFSDFLVSNVICFFRQDSD
jgi:hypothetical protein